MSDTIVFFTAKSIERILEEGGASSYRLSPTNALRCEYAVCARNAHKEWGDGPEAHYAAFLVGKISDVVETAPTPENNESPKNRYLVRFSEYATIDIPDLWPERHQNPFFYSTLKDLGIHPNALNWQPMPEQP